MKMIPCLLCVWAGVILLAPASHADDLVFSSFQCDPSSCAEQSLPGVVGTAFVSFSATCTGGVVSTIEGSAKSVIGVNGPCSTPFIAQAEIQQSTQTQLDDFGCPFNLSTVTELAEILTPFGSPVFIDMSGASCDGGTFGPTANGTRPC